MNRPDAPQDRRIDALAAKIIYHQDRYYNASSEISDLAFDALWDELRRLAPEHPVLQNIGRDENAMYAKREHRMVLHSQDKVNSEEEFTAWAEKSVYPPFLVQHKLDGISFELQYDAGKFVAGVSRGDGRVGDDLTHNAIRIPNIPFTIDQRFTGAVRGELIMERAIHRRYFPDLANTRNTTSGIMKRKDGKGIEHVRLICYDARSTNQTRVFSNEPEKLDWLALQGFIVVETAQKDSIEQVLTHRRHLIEKRTNIPYDIDGLVIKGVSIDEKDSEKNRPEKQIAFKFDVEQTQTTLESIEWNRNGHRITPIALFTPVHLHGTQVKRASLVNLQGIGDLGITLGAKIVVSKRGEIIPKVESVVATPKNAFLPLPPYRCDDCNELFLWRPTEILCINPHCRSRAHHRTLKWIQIIGLEGFGKKRVEQLFDLGIISDIPDLYALDKESLIRIERFGEQLADNLLTELREKSEIDLASCIAGFDIAGIGTLTAQKIVNAGYVTVEALGTLTHEQLCEIQGIGDILARVFVEELHLHLPAIKKLVEMKAIRIKDHHAESNLSDIQGKNFCFTGTLSSLSRKQAAQSVTQLGGIVKTSVGADLDYLVLASLDSQSSKAEKARELGITLLDEALFLKLISD